MLAGEAALHQIVDDHFAIGREHLLRDLLAGVEEPPGSGTRRGARPILNSSSPAGLASMMKPAFGAGDLDRRVHHEREHFVQHTGRSQRPQAVEERRNLPEVDDRRGVRSVGVRGVVEQEHQLGAAAAPQADPIAVREHLLGDRLVVDERSAPRVAIAKQPAPAAVLFDLGMLARDVDADDLQLAFAAPADAEQGLVDRHDAPAQGVADLKSGRDGHSACRSVMPVLQNGAVDSPAT